MKLAWRILVILCLAAIGCPGAEARVRGLWVWKTGAVLEKEGSVGALKEFCRSNGVNEVYVSMTSKAGLLEDERVMRW